MTSNESSQYFISNSAYIFKKSVTCILNKENLVTRFLKSDDKSFAKRKQHLLDNERDMSSITQCPRAISQI